MSIDTYGLPSEQYEEFFDDNIQSAAQLYVRACKILKDNGADNLDYKTILDLYQEAVYGANDDCRRYQNTNNPEALKNTDFLGVYPSREELLVGIQSANAKIEALADYIAQLVIVANNNLDGTTETLVD